MNVIIYGKGDFAKLILHYIQLCEKYNIVGFCVDAPFHDDDIYLGYPLYNIDEIDEEIDTVQLKAFLAVGYSSMPIRESMFNKLVAKGFEIINIICEGAKIDKTVDLGVNNIFMPNVLIEPFAKIGDNNIFWTNALVCHDTIIGSHNFFASNTVVGGFSKINDRNFFGFGSIVADNLKVSSGNILGASSTLLKSINIQGKYLGSPAKLVTKD